MAAPRDTRPEPRASGRARAWARRALNALRSALRRVATWAIAWSKWRALWRWALRGLLVLVTLFAAALVMIHTDWGRARLLRWALDTVNESIRGELSATHLEGSILGSPRLTGVEVRSPEGEVVARVATVDLHFDLLALARKHIRIEELVIAHPWVRVYEGPAGQEEIALARAFEPRTPAPETPPEPLAWTIELTHLVVTDGHIEQHAGADAIVVDGLQLGATIAIEDGLIRWREVTLDANLKGLPVDTLHLASAGELVGQVLHLDRAAVDVGLARLEVSGVVALDPVAFDLRVERLELGLSDASHAGLINLPITVRPQDQVSVEGTVRGPAHGELEAKFALATPWGTFQLDARLTPGDGPRYAATVVGRGLRLGPWVPDVEQLQAATWEVHASLEGAGDPTREGHAVLALTATPTLPVAALPIGQLTANAELTAGHIDASSHLQLSDGGTLALWARGRPLDARAELDVGAKLEQIDLATVGALAGVEGHAGLVVELDAHAKVTRAPDVPPVVDGALSLTGRDLRVLLADGEATARLLDASIEGGWDGVELPHGEVHLSLDDVSVAGASARDLQASLQMSHLMPDPISPNASPPQVGRRLVGTMSVRDVAAAAGQVESVQVSIDAVAHSLTEVPVGDVEVQVADARWDTSAVRSLTADVHVSEGAFALPRLTVNARAEGLRDGPTHARRLSAHGTFEEVTPGIASVALRGDLNDVRLSPLQKARHLSVRATARGPLDDPSSMHATFDVAGRTVTLAEGLTLPKLRVNGALALAQGQPISARVTARGTDLSWSGRHVEQVDVRARLVRGGKLEVRAAAVGGDVGVRADAAVQLPRGKRPASVRIRALQVDGPQGGLRFAEGAQLAFDAHGGVTVEGLVVDGTGPALGSITLGAVWKPRRGQYEAHLTADQVDVATWIDALEGVVGADVLPTVTGSIDGQLVLEITPQTSPRATSSLRLRDVGFGELVRGVELDVESSVDGSESSVHVAARWPGYATLDVCATGPPGGLDGFPQAPFFDPDLPLTIAGTADLEDLARLNALFSFTTQDLAGTAHASLDLAGPARDPRGQVQFLLDDLAVGSVVGTRVEGSVSLGEQQTDIVTTIGDVQGRWLELRVMVPENLGAILGPDGVEGVLDRLRSEPLSLALEIADLSASRVPLPFELPPWLHETTLQANVTAKGTLDALALGGFVEGKAELGDSPAVVRADLTGNGGDVGLRLTAGDGQTSWLSGQIEAPGLVAAALGGGDPWELLRDERMAARLELDLPREVVGKLCAAANSSCGGAFGLPEVTLQVHLTGRPTGPLLRIVGDVAVDPTAPAGLVTSGLRLEGRVDADSSEVTFWVQPRGGGAGLRAASTLGIGLDGLRAAEIPWSTVPVAATLTSDGLDIAQARSFAPEVITTLAGTLHANAALSGTVGAPKMQGSLELRLEELEEKLLGLSQKDLVVRLEFDNDQIRLVPLVLQDSKGQLSMEASLGVASFDPASMPLNGHVLSKHFRLVRRRDASARVSADLALGGTLLRPSVRGSITIDEAVLRPAQLDRRLAPTGPLDDVVFMAPSDPPHSYDVVFVPPVAGSESTRRVRVVPSVVVSVRMPERSVRVEHDVIDVFLAGTVEVVVRGGDLRVTGPIGLDGVVTMSGSRFVFADEARIVFSGTKALDPTLDVAADYDISAVDLSPIDLLAAPDSRIRLHVTGRASTPKLELSSAPQMEETYIASILALGRVEGEQSTLSVEAQAAQLVAALATGSFANALATELQLDVLALGAGDEGLTDARITAGKRISRDIMVFYKANLGATEEENRNEVAVRIFLTRLLSLESHFGDAGAGALDFLVRWKW